MANKIIQYQCKSCKHIQQYNFKYCPACGKLQDELSFGEPYKDAQPYSMTRPYPSKCYDITTC